MEFEPITPEQLIGKIVQKSKGAGGIVIVPLSAWRRICSAYDSPLIRIIEGESLVAHPLLSSPSRKLSFRVEELAAQVREVSEDD